MTRNEEVTALLEAIASALELQPGNRFRVRAYQEAARNVGFLEEDVADLWRAQRLQEVPGVGQSIAQKIGEFLESGRSSYLEQICVGFPPAVLALTRVPGLGPRKAKLLYEKLGVLTTEDLEAAARAHRICGVRGMGERTQANLLKELERLQTRSRRLPLGVVWPLADGVGARLRQARCVVAAEPAGSIRRRREDIGDIDVLVAAADPAAVRDAVAALPEAREIVASGSTKITFLSPQYFQIDVRVVRTSVAISTYTAATRMANRPSRRWPSLPAIAATTTSRSPTTRTASASPRD